MDRDSEIRIAALDHAIKHHDQMAIATETVMCLTADWLPRYGNLKNELEDHKHRMSLYVSAKMQLLKIIERNNKSNATTK